MTRGAGTAAPGRAVAGTVLAPRRRWVRVAAGVAAGPGIAALLGGCMYLSPAQTTVIQNESDGAIATVGSLKLSDVLVVATGKGSPGRVDGMVSNPTNSNTRLSVSAPGQAAVTVTVPAQTAVRLDGQASGDSTARIAPLRVTKVPVAPGRKMTLTFATPASGRTPVRVPVLLDQNQFGSASPTHPTYSPPPNPQTTEPNG